MQCRVVCDQCSGGYIAVAAKKFRSGMNHDIGAQRQRLLEDWWEHGIVYSEKRSCWLCDPGRAGYVRSVKQGVSGVFDQNESCLSSEGGADRSEIGRIGVTHSNILALPALFQQPHCPAIEIVAGDNLF